MKNNKKRNLLLSLILAAVCIVFLLYVDKFQHYSMLATVLKKGAVYAVVASSMNLLNGFTGLFSLGQAGFMLLGAYTYAILTIPVESRAVVYQYYDGGLIQFAMPVIPALILAGLMAAAFAVLLFFLKDNLKVEYEYTFTNGSLDFAKVFRQAKRKELGSMNVKNVSACGHVAGDSFRRYLAMKDVEKKNWFANRDGNLFYFYYVKESKKHMIIIEPSEEMVEMIRQYLPAGVYQG